MQAQFVSLVAAQTTLFSDLFADPFDVQAKLAALAAQGCSLAQLLGTAQATVAFVTAVCAIDGATPPAMPVLPPGYTYTTDGSGQPVTLVDPPATAPLNPTATLTTQVDNTTTPPTVTPGATIAWTAVTGAINYWLERSGDSGVTWVTIAAQVTSNSFFDTTALRGMQYRVRSQTGAGYSGYSVVVTL
jgi:hypothetical protein